MSMHQALLAPLRHQTPHSQTSHSQTSCVLIDSLELSPYLIDRLADMQQDWVSQLPHDWEVDFNNAGLNHVNLTGEHPLKASSSSGTTVADLIALIGQSLQPVTIVDQTHWCYTCCLRLDGIGRIRLVLSFDQAQPGGTYTALATNRLDWSPRTVLTHWQQQFMATE